MKHKCEVISDLIPLYAENLCSEESSRIVAEHIAECPDCCEKLKKMNTGISVRADKDISVIRKIKKRIRIEKIAITAAVGAAVIAGMWFTGFFLTNTTCNMDYEKYGLSENVWVEEDENGNIWFVGNDKATVADSFFSTVRDTDGNHMGYDKNFDSESANAYGLTLTQTRISSLSPVDIKMLKPERILLFNKNEKEKINEVFYFDADNNKEYTLWKRS